jgi:hypothetical protein
MEINKLKELINQALEEILNEEGNVSSATGVVLGIKAFKKPPKMKPLEEKMGALGPHAFRKPNKKHETSKTGFEEIPNLDLHMEPMKFKIVDSKSKEEPLNEVRYSQFKSQSKTRTPQEQLHMGVKEMQRKLDEINRLVDFTTRMKTELKGDAEEMNLLKRTHNSLFKINEKIQEINDKIKGLTT